MVKNIFFFKSLKSICLEKLPGKTFRKNFPGKLSGNWFWYFFSRKTILKKSENISKNFPELFSKKASRKIFSKNFPTKIYRKFSVITFQKNFPKKSCKDLSRKNF